MKPLRNCPFCGADGEQLEALEIDAGQHAVACASCTAIGPSDITRERAEALWNGAALAALGRRAEGAPC